MATFPFQYTPENLALGDKPRWVSATDGDTPSLELPVRMLGMDAPELHYGGATAANPGKHDAALKGFLAGAGKDLDVGLKAYLAGRLGDKACTSQITAGAAAYQRFQEIVAKRLDRGTGKNGKPLTPRHIFSMVSNEVFDRYGRMLAYLNASYAKQELSESPAGKRPTFNLQMLREGQAVSLVIYPNIPKPADLALVQTGVRNARTGKLGMWADDSRVLLPYEFRWIVDTIAKKRNGPDRYCADISSGRLYQPQQYYKVLPEDRLFFYAQDFTEAVKMGFVLSV
jgi:endonuclease YncB( thermonuclease family)